jgi:hypothetical protein
VLEQSCVQGGYIPPPSNTHGSTPQGGNWANSRQAHGGRKERAQEEEMKGRARGNGVP